MIKFRRHAGSRDKNHRAIVEALEDAGRSVLEIWDLPPGNRHRKGAPDILVGWGGHMLLLEIKNPATRWGKELQEEQRAWHYWWRGTKVVVVRTIAEALEATGVAAAHVTGPPQVATVPQPAYVKTHGTGKGGVAAADEKAGPRLGGRGGKAGDGVGGNDPRLDRR